MRLGCDLFADPALDRRAFAGGGARPSPDRGQARLGIGALAILTATIGLLLFLTLREDPDARAQARENARVPWTTETLVVDPRYLRPVDEAEAQRINAALPISDLPVVSARPLAIPPALGTSWERSVECLTQAIYYEAATEPDEGKRAVAQVVLNRVRHPAFPNTVCGVVYQGSERRTGCQFSFTCDGSLARQPMASHWTRARQLAVAAISGYVYPGVGLSTFYHADYVAPYWAPSLAKVAKIGRHIFYRWGNRQGEASAFSASYAGAEPDLAQLMAAAYSGPAAGAVPIQTASQAALAPTARPILSGNAMPLEAAPGMPAPPPPTTPAGSRWVLGMDGPGNGSAAKEGITQPTETMREPR